MTTPAINTKVETLVEATESFMIAVRERDYESVRIAREDYAEALLEFLRPALRRVGDPI